MIYCIMLLYSHSAETESKVQLMIGTVDQWNDNVNQLIMVINYTYH